MLTFFVIIVLAFSVVVQSTDATQSNTTILDKRSNSTYDGGAIDYLARRAGFFGMGKLKQKIMGKSSPQVVSVPLDYRESVHLWIAQIQLGKRYLPFRVAVGTGTGLLWVSYHPDKTVNPVSYESGPVLPNYKGLPGFRRGVIYGDTIRVGKIKGPGMVIYAEQLTPSFRAICDGVLGLALSARDAHDAAGWTNAIPFVKFLSIYSSPIFALYLASGDSMMHIGGTDARFYTGDIERHPVTKLQVPHLWQIGGASIFINDHEVATISETVLDTGTWEIYGPPDKVERIYRSIRGEGFPPGHSYDIYHCHSPPKLAIRWKGGKLWTIDPKNFGHALTNSGGVLCEGILKKNFFGPNIWTVGTSVMKDKMYIIFDATSNPRVVGLAEQNKHPSLS